MFGSIGKKLGIGGKKNHSETQASSGNQSPAKTLKHSDNAFAQNVRARYATGHSGAPAASSRPRVDISDMMMIDGKLMTRDQVLAISGQASHLHAPFQPKPAMPKDETPPAELSSRLAHQESDTSGKNDFPRMRFDTPAAREHYEFFMGKAGNFGKTFDRSPPIGNTDYEAPPSSRR